jgi:ABC-type branched-subunit amino acid transport system ATPase component
VTATDVLEIRKVSKAFGGVHALVDLDVDIGAHPVVSIIGPNGAGKTTLLNVVSGFLRPDIGHVLYRGRDLCSLRPDQINAIGVVRTFQLPRPFASLSVLENLLTFGAEQPGELPTLSLLYARRARSREAEIIGIARGIAQRLRLESVIDRSAIELSGGQKKLLDLGRALMCAPQLILLDEPVSGVNPALSETIAGAIKEFAADGYRFVIVEHNMNFVRTISDHVVVLADGQLLAQGSFVEIMENAQVQEAYFGGRRRQA